MLREAVSLLLAYFIWGAGLCLRIAGIVTMLAAFACWGFQIYAWLKEGVWIPIPIGAFIDFKGMGWLGVDKILLWLLDINIGVLLLLGGSIAFTLSGSVVFTMVDDKS